MKKIRIVIKIGSNVLTGDNDRINKSQLASFTEQIADLRQAGYQVVVVTSGAVSSGKEILNLSKLEDKIAKRQVLAAVGQARLMELYSSLFAKRRLAVAQILPVRQDFLSRDIFNNFQKTITQLLDHQVVPIINENDAMAVKDSSFLDNDQLAALTAVAIGADILLLLTNIDGLYSSDPQKDPEAKLIREVKDMGVELEKMCSKETSRSGLGGMLAKVRAARLVAKNGTKVIIANGLNSLAIINALDGKTQRTVFYPAKRQASNREKWLLLGASAKGKIEVDDGAALALKSGKSLLAVGVSDIIGDFQIRDIVEIVNRRGETLACGIVNYSKKDLYQVLAYRQQKNNKKIKKKFNKEVIHVDNLTIL